MAIEKDILDQLLSGRDPKEVFSRDGLVDELKKALSERIWVGPTPPNHINVLERGSQAHDMNCL
jgi:hypothetical protein